MRRVTIPLSLADFMLAGLLLDDHRRRIEARVVLPTDTEPIEPGNCGARLGQPQVEDESSKGTVVVRGGDAVTSYLLGERGFETLQSLALLRH